MKKPIILTTVAGFAMATMAAAETPVLTVMTYDSFVSDWGPGPAIEAAFEEVCACDLPAWLDRASWQAVVYPWPWQDHDPDWAHLADLPMWRWGDPVDDLLRWTPDRQAQWAAWDAGLRDV